MSKYDNRLGLAANARDGFDPDLPVAGFYRIKLRKGGPPVAVRIWFGQPIDPDTGEEMSERSPRWQCAVNGERVPVEDQWPGCARVPISKAEHDRIVRESMTMDPDSHFYDPRRPVDRLSAPMPF